MPIKWIYKKITLTHENYKIDDDARYKTLRI